jgi:hypothetical protein
MVTALASATGMSRFDDDQTRIAMSHYAACAEDRATFRRALDESIGGRDLRELGFERDIARAAEWDLFRVVPEFSASEGRIVAAGDALTGNRWLAPPR